MARILRCTNGHKWTDTVAPDATTADNSNACPVCGSKFIEDQEGMAGAEAGTDDRTLAAAAHMGNPTDLITVSADVDQKLSDLTGPTVPAEPFDLGENAATDISSLQPGPGEGTLPFTPSDVDALDRTEGGEESSKTPDRTEEDKGDVPERDKTMGQTQATAVGGRPTAEPAKPGAVTGKRPAPAATTARRGRGAKLPDKIPGYEILGELGRGGMGVVYKARQAGLNRLCALKMILAGGLASADAIARFKIEAEAIAHLQHPNIVQVYEIGEAADCPYFSLEFVDGSNLQAKIAATPQGSVETARLMQQICQGVEAAHKRGVLHRDLKPANVLLTKDNIPKITDFGLAKRIEEKDQGQTRTGAILGTPSYMAPEQAMGRAKEVGPAADIYSLGAVLYDMLTGRPPFRGETVMDTLNQVQKLEPLPPRDLVPKVPLDLQTICLKALEKDPKKRYETAGAMADDLRRFLAGEPILARPTPAWERAAKWARRRPALATAISVSSVALITVLTLGGLWLNTQRVWAADRAAAAVQRESAANELAKVSRERADQQAEIARQKEAMAIAEKNRREEAERLQGLADKHFKQARTAVNEMLKNVGGRELRFDPGMELVRRGLVTKALDFYLDFLKDRDTDPSLQAETADADFLVGNVYRDLGQYDDSMAHYKQALKRYDELQRENPSKAGFRFGVAEATMEIANTQLLQGQFQQSEKGYRQAISLFGPLAREFPAELIYRDDTASSFDNLGSICLKLGRYKEAEANFDEALKMRGALMAEGFKDAESRNRLARLQRNRAALLVKLDRLGEAEKALLASRDIAKTLSKEVPDVPDYAADWALSCMNLAICYGKLGKSQPAVDALREAIGILEGLKSDYPRTPVFGQDLARAHNELGIVYGNSDKIQQAHDEFVRAVEILRQVLAKQPNLAAARLQLAQSRISLGTALFHMEKLDEATAQYRQGVNLLEKMKPSATTTPDVCNELARGQEYLARVLTALKKPAEADQCWGRLLTLRHELAKAFPDSLDRRRDLATTESDFALRFEQGDKKPQALMHWQEAAKQWAQCMVLTEKDSAGSDQDRKALLKTFGENALVALQRAVGLGFADFNLLKTAPEFQLLRQWPEFQRLVSAMEAKKKN
jgi:eukaryotic-like serine/threonine-protein kinase